MKIGIIGPSKLSYLEEVNAEAKIILSRLAKIIAEKCHDIVITPDKGSVSEYFAREYEKSGGNEIYNVIPLDEEEFGLSWMNQDLGEKINCGTWRNQPEKLNEETDILLCVGYAVGVLAEIAYSKWFNPKKVFIINELVSGKLPLEVERSLNLNYISEKDIDKFLK